MKMLPLVKTRLVLVSTYSWDFFGEPLRVETVTETKMPRGKNFIFYVTGADWETFKQKNSVF